MIFVMTSRPLYIVPVGAVKVPFRLVFKRKRVGRYTLSDLDVYTDAAVSMNHIDG